MSTPDQVEEMGKKLVQQETQIETLHHLLEHAAKGHDISSVAERVVRYCLFSTLGTTPRNLSLSLDVLTSSPSHAFWVDTLSVIVENLRRHDTSACLVVLLKIPSLPHAALQHLSLYSSSILVENLQSDKSSVIRKAAVNAVSAFVLRSRPLTASCTEPIRLEKLTEKQLKVTRNAIERFLHALLKAIFDPADEVATLALSLLTRYALEGESFWDVSVLNASKRATSRAVWDVLASSCKRISERFRIVFSRISNLRGNEQGKESVVVRQGKEATKGIARLIAHILSDAKDHSLETQAIAKDPSTHPDISKWAIGWVDSVLLSLCDNGRVEMAICACSSLLLVCSYAVHNPSPENIANWGIKAVRRITRILHEQEHKMPVVIMVGLVQDATHGLAALSKNDFVNSKFILYTAVGLLPFAARCPGTDTRLEALSVIASTAVEYDLSGRDAGVGVSMKAILASDSWKSIIASGKDDSNIPSELVCCFSQSLLEASRRIFTCVDSNLRLSLTHTWAVMVSHFMGATIQCLNWLHSSASSYAKEMYLKLFDALGQYSAFLMRSQGIGMEEYERLQEMLVKATLDQQEVGTRASLLVCVTKYWLSSGMKAESNAGHILKSVWKHAQEHYKDEEILLRELKTGALWSEAKQGFKTPSERAVEGGYKSMATAVTQRTLAVLDTVGVSVSNAIEATLFGSVALGTAASECSTLTTDFIYSGLSALLTLVGHAPPLAERAISVLKKYIAIMDEAESSDYIALEAVRNTISALQMYEDEFFPRPVLVRSDDRTLRYCGSEIQKERNDPLSWMRDISASCVYATSRLKEQTKESSAVVTEEAVLRVAAITKQRMRAFGPATMRSSTNGTQDVIEGDQQTLSGSSDPFSVVASHSMDTVKGLALLRVEIINRSVFRATNVSLVWSASGALSPLPDAATSYSLGTMSAGMIVGQRITLGVRTDQGYAGKVFFSVCTRRESESKKLSEEQSCIPYYIPSSDVLLLRKPAPNAGVDVFRRRWDLMRHSLSFHVFIRKDQTVDGCIDTLERRSKCLRQIGRMRTYSHVCALVADSSRGDYVSVAGVAPEARGNTGEGPCMLYVTIRSNSDGYNRAFREECREWLKSRFRIIFLDENLSKEDERLALRPQDAFFITESNNDMSPYERWRVAHAVRVTY